MIRSAIGLLVVFTVLVGLSSGLDQGEVQALTNLLSSFPSLLQVNPADQYDTLDYDWGGSWTKEMADICGTSGVWDVHGIHCRNGHIDAIRLSPSWGSRIGNSPDISGLIWVTNFTLAPTVSGKYADAEAANDFMVAVLALPTLRSVEIKTWPTALTPPLVALEAANLTHATLRLPYGTAFSFASMMFLAEVTIWQDIFNFTQFAASASTLRSLVVNAIVHSSLGIEDLVVLENLGMTRGPEDVDWNPFLIPPSLKTLYLNDWTSSTLHIGSSSSTLESLIVDGTSAVTTIGFLPPTLKRIVLSSWVNPALWNPVLADCNWEYFEMSSTGTMSLPNLALCPHLKTLRLRSLNIDPLNDILTMDLSITELEDLAIEGTLMWPESSAIATTAQDWLCSLPVTLKRLSFLDTAFNRFDECVSQFTALESLNVDQITLDSNDPFLLANITSSLKELTANIGTVGYESGLEGIVSWQRLVDSFPSLIKLDVSPSGSIPVPFPSEELKQLTSLERLQMSGLHMYGSLPADFFEVFENISFIDLSLNSLNGTVPSSGWGSLTSLSLNSNEFSAWNTVDAPGAPFLKEISLGSNRLSTIPDDSVFLAMSSLRSLSLSFNPSLTALPKFWANGEHKLLQLELANCALTGPLPTTIRTPFLRYLYLQNNQLCGSLPETAAPVSFVAIFLHANLLSGTIPASWAQNFTATVLEMRANLLSGTIPDPFISNYSALALTSLSLQDNYFTGQMPNLTQFGSLSVVYLSGANMTLELCADAPTIPSIMAYCELELYPSICACSALYSCSLTITSYCSTTSPESLAPFILSLPRLAIPPPTLMCITPPEEMVPNVTPPSEVSPGGEMNCPLPSPGSSFYCDNGIWKSHGSVTQPTFTVPGSSQPGTTTIIVIEGNLTVTEGGITFNGFETQIIVNGCIFLGDNQVTIELTPEEIEKLSKEGKIPKTLLTTLGDNDCLGSSDLTGTKVIATKSAGSKGCRKVKAKNSGSSKSSLTVIFEINNSTCNMIIIIPSVIGGIIILAGIALAIGLYLRHQKFKSVL